MSIKIEPHPFGVVLLQQKLDKTRSIQLSSASFEKLNSIQEEIQLAVQQHECKEWILEQDGTASTRANIQLWNDMYLMHIRSVSLFSFDELSEKLKSLLSIPVFHTCI